MVYLTKKEEKLFTDRSLEMKELKEGLELLKKDVPKNFSLIGLRKIGKTLLLRKFMGKKGKGLVPTIFNIEENFSPPEDFALRFVYSLFYSLNPDGDYLPNLSELNKIKPKADSADQIVNLFISEYQKKKPNRLLLIQKSFELPEKLANDLNVKFVIILDEFQAILDLDNYREIKNILGSIRSYFEHTENVMWIISGSSISLMTDITSGSKSPFFQLFSNIKLDFFSKQDALRHITKIEKILGAEIDDLLKKRIFQFTRGHPFYVYCITDKLCSISKSPKLRDLTTSILEEVLTPNARVYNHCKYVFTTSLERARGKVTLKKVLETLSERDLISISEISEATRMTIQTVNVSLIRLIEVDLIEKIGKKYRICDPIMGFWVKNVFLGGGDITRIKKSKLKQIKQELLKTKKELGLAKEYELGYKLGKKLGIKLDKYLEDGIEFDLVGKDNGVYHIFEIKWRNRKTGINELKKFLEKVKNSEFKQKKKIIYFFSKSGFSDSARKFAKKNGIELMEDL